MRTVRAAAAACAAVVLLVTGCSGKPPVLSRVFGRVIYVHDSAANTSSESLGVFLVATREIVGVEESNEINEKFKRLLGRRR